MWLKVLSYFEKVTLRQKPFNTFYMNVQLQGTRIIRTEKNRIFPAIVENCLQPIWQIIRVQIFKLCICVCVVNPFILLDFKSEEKAKLFMLLLF